MSCLPVVDGKTLVGIVTTSDLVELVGHDSRPIAESERPRGPNSQTFATVRGVAKT